MDTEEEEEGQEEGLDEDDIMGDFCSAYEARRAHAVVDGTIANVRVEFGKDSHSWLCNVCHTFVDATQESHRMGCWVAWGGAGGP